MSYNFSGSNQTITGSFATTYSDPLTFACYVKATHGTVTDALVYLGNSSSSNNDSYGLRMSAGAQHDWQLISTDAAAATATATRNQNIDGAWNGIVGKITTGDSDRVIYVGALANSDTSTADRAVAAIQHIRFGETFVAGNDYTGLLAEVAVWNIALSDEDITSYLSGTAASQIQAANLVGYWPLSVDGGLSNEGVDTGGDLSATGASFSADHPTITGGSAAPRKRRTGLMGVG